MLALGGAGLLTLSVAQAASITWGATGSFTDNTVLTLAGAAANEVYGVDFGAGVQTTANSYTFSDYTAGNMTMSGPSSSYNGFLGNSTTGDSSFDTVLANAIYGGGFGQPGGLGGTLNNLTVGQNYTVMALLVIPWNQGATFVLNDDISDSPSQQYGYNTYDSVNPVALPGGYIMGTFTADATTQALNIITTPGASSQYAAILLEAAPVPEPGVCALFGGGVMLLFALRRKK